MKYILKKDLPGIKAGVEMERTYPDGMWFFPTVNASWYFPSSEFSDWIEEVDETKPWKLRIGEKYYIPSVWEEGLIDWFYSDKGTVDEKAYKRNLICRTPEEAIELANVALKAIKEYREKK